MGKKGQPAAPIESSPWAFAVPRGTPQDTTNPEMAAIQEQLRQAEVNSDIRAMEASLALSNAQASQDRLAKELEAQLKAQEEALKAPKDMVLGSAPTNIDFKTFTPTTPNVSQPAGIEGTRLTSTTTTTPTTSNTRGKVKDPLGLGLTGLDFGLNT